jgi:hypothetical protein
MSLEGSSWLFMGSLMARAEFRVVCRDDYTKVLFYGGDQTIFRLQKQLLHGGARAARPKPLTFKLIGSFKRRQKTSRQKKPDQKLLPQRQGPLSPKVHANERPLLHRGAQATHEAPLHPRFTIHDQQSTISISLLLRVHSRFHHLAESIGAARPQRPTG